MVGSRRAEVGYVSLEGLGAVLRKAVPDLMVLSSPVVTMLNRRLGVLEQIKRVEYGRLSDENETLDRKTARETSLDL
jgi:hypothetical protein